MIISVLKTMTFLLAHPACRNKILSAVSRFLRWQIATRLMPFPIAIPFVNGMYLVATRGMTGATGNWYCGLHEYEDMSFVLDVLAPEEVFADVGANVGSYSILAASIGAKVYAFEPIPATFNVLRRNVRFNCLDDQVVCVQSAVGATVSELVFSAELDTTNHVIAGDESVDGALACPVTTLDSSLIDECVAMVKIDVEGFERAVIAGAENTLMSSSLFAVILELNGSGMRYGSADSDLHDIMVAKGFVPCRYLPDEKQLIELSSYNTTGGNTIYIKDVEGVRARLLRKQRSA